VQTVQGDIDQSALVIQLDFVSDLKSIPDHEQRSKGGNCSGMLRQLLLNLMDQVMGQLRQKDQHLLGLEGFLVTLVQADALLAIGIRGFHASIPQIIGIQHGCHELQIRILLGLWATSQPKKRAIL
jgi:hypothetical protein